jgi:hypothetical protein
VAGTRGESGGLRTDLVLEGGGVTGIGLVGALSGLEARGYRFSRAAGTSAGAVVGAPTCFDRRDGQPLRWPSIGIKLADRPAQTAPAFEVCVLLSLNRTMGRHHDQLPRPSPPRRSGAAATTGPIFVDTQGVLATNFHLDKRAQRPMSDHGRRAASHGPLDTYLQRQTARSLDSQTAARYADPMVSQEAAMWDLDRAEGVR